jgi:FAD synthase
MNSLRGVVIHGDHRGRELGFPTANLDGKDCPLEDGVWPALVRRSDGQGLGDGAMTAFAAVSIGRRPTYYGRSGVRLVEAHLLDFAGDLYGVELHLQFGARIRGQRKFDGVEELVIQMSADVAAVRDGSWLRDFVDHSAGGVAHPGE